jgi:AcrR family transcriptional regulator
VKIRDEKIHDSIIKATEKLFFRHGIKGWNMDTVARETGMAKNTLYKIIGTKELLIEKIVITRLKNNIDAIVEIFKNEPDFLKAVETGAHHLSHSISMENPLALPQVFLEYPGIKEKFNGISRKLGRSIHGYLNKARRAGIIRKDVDNDILISVVTAVINHYLTGNFRGKEFEDRIYAAFMYLLKGILS